MVKIMTSIETRFGAPLAAAPDKDIENRLNGMLERGSCRAFSDRAVEPHVLDILCAAALSAPTKSDLQQRDIIVIRDPALRTRLDALCGGGWIETAPVFLVFCGNNRRQRRLHTMRGHAFANDHLDAFFNAAVDAAIALGAFVTAAEAAGLGCCPVSAIRNEADAVSDVLGLPDHVFPVAGLALGYRQDPEPVVSLRLPLSVTVHRDRYSETGLDAAIAEYDARREAGQPYAAQRAVETFGTSGHYGWSEDKARQYALPERTNFGAFIRSKGFTLD